MALRIASIATPTSAKTASHMFAKPPDTQHHHQQFHRKSKDDILMHNPHRPARVADALRNLRRIVVHQHNIRRLDCGICADAAHRNADIRAAQHRRIVDAIARERHGVAVAQQAFERAYFILRQQLRAVVGQADLLGDVRRNFLAVARSA